MLCCTFILSLKSTICIHKNIAEVYPFLFQIWDKIQKEKSLPACFENVKLNLWFKFWKILIVKRERVCKFKQNLNEVALLVFLFMAAIFVYVLNSIVFKLEPRLLFIAADHYVIFRNIIKRKSKEQNNFIPKNSKEEKIYRKIFHYP